MADARNSRSGQQTQRQSTKEPIGIVRDDLPAFKVTTSDEAISHKEWLLTHGYLLRDCIQQGAYSRVYMAWGIAKKTQQPSTAPAPAIATPGSPIPSDSIKSIKERFAAAMNARGRGNASTLQASKKGQEESAFLKKANQEYAKREPWAIKIVDFGAEKRKDVREKHLPREVDLQLRIRHPHIVRLHAKLGPLNNKLFLILEFVNGGD